MKRILTLVVIAGLYGTAQAQTAVIEYESPAAFRLHFKGTEEAAMPSGDRYDLTGDDVPELPLIRENDQDRPQTFAVIDLTTRRVVWEIPYDDIVALLGEEPIYFPGFFSFFEADRKAAVFRGETTLGIIAILIGKRNAAASVVLPAEQAMMLDIDQDGHVEAIIRNRDTRTVQIWGAGDTGTATEETIEVALQNLFQNYPNPFHETTTITYEVEQSGPVTIAIYDVLGRRVRTLIDTVQPAGTHRITWDGRDASGQPVAAGVYFYRWRMGETARSRQTLRLP